MIGWSRTLSLAEACIITSGLCDAEDWTQVFMHASNRTTLYLYFICLSNVYWQNKDSQLPIIS